MNFKIDENLPSEFVDLLTHAGFSADTVVQENLQGAADSAVANICQKESRILLTLDLDFSDIRTYQDNAAYEVRRTAYLARLQAKWSSGMTTPQ